MNPIAAKREGLFETINGGHLHWSDFRENVLQHFRIRCTASPNVNGFPTTFLARLQAAQKTISKHDAQRQAWRRDVSAGHGLVSATVFPPDLVPPPRESSQTLRCMLPHMSREGLPLRNPGMKGTLYELPTVKPIYVFGFNMEAFDRAERAHFNGALQVTGTSVDFTRGEVLPNRTLCCPYLAFETFSENSEQHIEKARNLCAITGAQCLRGQQNLFHKAFGLQTISQPSITFTCAINNEIAILNLHSIGDDGDYNMSPICRFDLQNDEHFNTLQAWIEAIDSWASMYLLPRLQSAVAQVMHAHPTPPTSPSPSNSSLLSIDTKSTNDLSIINELRRVCPSITWHNDISGETPINSSIAQCGTPLPTREIRGLALPRPSNSTCSSPIGIRRNSLLSPTTPGVLSPLRTDLSFSARYRPRSNGQLRFSFSPDDVAESESSGSLTPVSPCRPPSLSPCSPGPEMPMSNMNPMLVLQRRLDVACTEIQELRAQVDGLQGQLNDRTEALEQKMKEWFEKQERSASIEAEASTPIRTNVQIPALEDSVDQDARTPTATDSFPTNIPSSLRADTPELPTVSMPGKYEHIDDEDTSSSENKTSAGEDLLIWFLVKILSDTQTQLYLLASLFLTMTWSSGLLNLGESAVLVFVITAIYEPWRLMLWEWHGALGRFYQAVRERALESNGDKRTGLCNSGVPGESNVDKDNPTGEEPVTECIPIVLC